MKSRKVPAHPGPAPDLVRGLGSIPWWHAQNVLDPIRDDDTCEVRGDVMRELLRVYSEHTAKDATVSIRKEVPHAAA